MNPDKLKNIVKFYQEPGFVYPESRNMQLAKRFLQFGSQEFYDEVGSGITGDEPNVVDILREEGISVPNVTKPGYNKGGPATMHAEGERIGYYKGNLVRTGSRKGQWAVKFPEGTEITHTGWDTEEDTKAMGWTDYKSQKGFSSDIYVKVKLPNGEEQMHEVSLKKDRKINFLNSGAGSFREWDVSTKGSDIDPAVHAVKERKRLSDFGEKNKSEIEKIAKTNPE